MHNCGQQATGTQVGSSPGVCTSTHPPSSIPPLHAPSALVAPQPSTSRSRHSKSWGPSWARPLPAARCPLSHCCPLSAEQPPSRLLTRGPAPTSHPGHTKYQLTAEQPSYTTSRLPIARYPSSTGARCSVLPSPWSLPNPTPIPPPLARTTQLHKAHADRQDPAAAAEPPSARKQRSLVSGARAARPLAASL